MIARVCAVSAPTIASGVRLSVRGSTSAKTGRAPTSATVLAVDMKE